jgi:hypothetical protein
MDNMREMRILWDTLWCTAGAKRTHRKTLEKIIMIDAACFALTSWIHGT